VLDQPCHVHRKDRLLDSECHNYSLIKRNPTTKNAGLFALVAPVPEAPVTRPVAAVVVSALEAPVVLSTVD
jgi:hypothetical protein